MELPAKLSTLLKHLPQHIRNARNVRVHANKDTAAAARIVQKWRTPTNPISQTLLNSVTKADFIVGIPHADKETLKISQLLKKNWALFRLSPPH